MKNIWLVIAVIVMAGVLGYGVNEWLNGGKRDRAINNFSAQLKGIKYSIDSSRSATQALKMSVGEAKLYFPTLKEDLKKELDVKLRNALFTLNTKTEYHKDFKVIVKDSTSHKTKIAEVADWHDNWTTFNWYKPEDSDTASVIYCTSDSLFGALHKVTRTFREWWHGIPKKYDLTLKNYNPNSIIKYQRIIQIDK